MRNRKYAILAGAVVAAMPLASKAVTITYSLDFNDIMYSTTSNGTYTLATAGPAGTLTGTTAAAVLTIPSGDFFKIGIDATVTGDTTSADAFGDAAETLGVAAFQVGLSNSAGVTVASVLPYAAAVNTALTTPVINPNFSGTGGPGDSDGAGGVNASLGTAGSNTISGNYSAKDSYGGGAPAELYNSLKAKLNGSTGTSTTFTVTNNPTAFQYVVVNKPGHLTGTSTNVPATYKNQTFNAATDTFSAMPTLKVISGTPTTGTASSSSTHSIISLTAGSTPAANYGSNDGTITMTGVGNGSYNVAVAQGFTTATTGSVAVSGFNPVGDTEIYALKLSQNGSSIAITNTTLLNAIVSDINGGNGNNVSAGVTASLVTGAFTGLFPGYDILLTSNGFTAGAGGTAELGFDWSTDPGEQNAADAGITVTGVAAVPEPATAAGIVLGAAGLLLGRRRNKAVVA